MGGFLLTVALRVADRIVRALPRGAAYGLADLAGRAWYRLAPARRALVTESLGRVAAATGRPTDPRAIRAMVHRAFIEHARYYVELLRSPHYPDDRIAEIVVADDWDHWREVLKRGVVIAGVHLGNFEPFGHLVAAQGIRAVAPVEEIEPRALYEFLVERRASGGSLVEIVPLSRSRRRMTEALQRGGVAALIADRDLRGNGMPVTMFGHPTTLPIGPALLALVTDRPLIAAACYRDAPDRFRGHAWPVEVERSGDRRADTARIVERLARIFEEAIAAAPEQWFGCFQPYWTDQRQRAAAERHS
jgi:lauroyl/myristoyl acyltransferase